MCEITVYFNQFLASPTEFNKHLLSSYYSSGHGLWSQAAHYYLINKIHENFIYIKLTFDLLQSLKYKT